MKESIENKQNFIKAFDKVFNKDLTLKVCGRDACERLIEIADELDCTIDFGDSYTGIMNVNNIITLYKEIKEQL